MRGIGVWVARGTGVAGRAAAATGAAAQPVAKSKGRGAEGAGRTSLDGEEPEEDGDWRGPSSGGWPRRSASWWSSTRGPSWWIGVPRQTRRYRAGPAPLYSTVLCLVKQDV